MLRGMREEQKESRGLYLLNPAQGGDVDRYRLLSGSAGVSVSFADNSGWSETVEAMRSLGFSEDEASQARTAVTPSRR